MKILIILAGCLSTSNALAKTTQPIRHLVVFVPGFFNSFAPEYFSKDIIRTIQSQKIDVVIAQNLNPIGTLQDNGDRIYNLLLQLKIKYPQAQIDIIGHSAGGLYALYAINKGAHFVRHLVTVSTPFNGIDFIENWRDRSLILNRLLSYSSLEGLRQLTSPFVQIFLKNLQVPEHLKITAFAGYQPVKLDITDAANMSFVLSVTDSYIKGPSDGVVSFSSALFTTYIQTRKKTFLKIKTEKKFYIPLEHWEQVLDYRHFVILGVTNIEVIRDRQIQFYSEVASYLLEKNNIK